MEEVDLNDADLVKIELSDSEESMYPESDAKRTDIWGFPISPISARKSANNDFSSRGKFKDTDAQCLTCKRDTPVSFLYDCATPKCEHKMCWKCYMDDNRHCAYCQVILKFWGTNEFCVFMFLYFFYLSMCMFCFECRYQYIEAVKVLSLDKMC